jgi:hypothetical protein
MIFSEILQHLNNILKDNGVGPLYQMTPEYSPGTSMTPGAHLMLMGQKTAL